MFNKPAIEKPTSEDPQSVAQPGSSSPFRSQLLAHVPIAIVVAGVLATMVALHVAVTGLLLLAVAHVALGLVLLLVRRHHGQSA